MNYKVGVNVFLAITLALAATVPALNLAAPQIRAQAFRLYAKKDAAGLKKLLFQGDQIESWMSGRLWPTGISIAPRDTIIGYDSWLHLGDRFGHAISIARGDAAETWEIKAKMVGISIMQWNNWMEKQGVQSMVFMLAPNKASIYPQTLPKWARPLSTNPLDALKENAQAVVLDLRYHLKNVAATTPSTLYLKTDTHWNQLGAAHAFVSLGHHLHQFDPELKWLIDSPIYVTKSSSRSGGDLANFLRIQNKVSDLEIRVGFDRPERFTTTVSDFDTNQVLFKRKFPLVDAPDKTLISRTPAALNKRRVLWVTDSFGRAMSPMMTATFEQTVHLHWRRGMKDDAKIFKSLISRWRPDIVIFTVVERSVLTDLSLSNPPESE